MSWRVVMVQETGERAQYGDHTFPSAEDASDWINRQQLERQHPECRFYVEPDILAPWAVAGFWQ